MLVHILLLTLSASPPPRTSSVDQAWSILQEGAGSKSPDQRAKAIHALALLTANRRAQEMAEKALADSSSNVRVEAATSLGQMGAFSARPKLRTALEDKEAKVVVAAANALFTLKDPVAYEVYYALLTGQRKSSSGLLQSELDTLHDRKAVEKLALETGVGFVPFGGMGWEAWKTVTKDDTSPVRAAAAEKLARDADPKSAEALAESCSDRKWRVRAAVVNAIAKRGDPGMLHDLEPLLEDSNDTVRFDAAAAILRLSLMSENHPRAHAN
jgi:HEAT repeat protein